MKQQTTNFGKAYLSVADISAYLDISTSAAYELAHRKDFPVCRLGSTIRIPTQLFLAWIELHTHIPAELLENKALSQKEVLHIG